MIKLLHFADVHIGMETFGKTDPSTGLSSRVMDFVHRLDEMVAYADEHEVDLAIFAGDAFKNRNPNPTYQREFAYRVQDLAKLCPVVLLVGNHDLPTNLKRASSVELYNTLHVPNVHVGMDYEVLRIQTKSGEVQVATAPYPVRARLIDDSHTNRSIGQLDSLLQEALGNILNDLAQQVEQSSAPRVLVGHFTIAGAVTGSEKSVMLGRDVAALLSEVAHPAWDYVAMGHIHKYQDLTKGVRGQPPVVYSGSMERIDFGEEGDPKGFVWVELERGQTRYQFIPLPKVRPFLTLRVDVRGSANPTQAVLTEIGKHRLKEAVVRVLITCDPATDAMLKIKLIEDELYRQEVNNVAGIQRQVERPERLRLGANPEGLTPLELLERYLISRDMPSANRGPLMEAAQEIFEAAEEQWR
jgi:exonuclease SbcD